MLVLSIGPVAVYTILAVVFLAIIGGGTYLGYRMNKGRGSDRPGDPAP